jgi:HEAT repeat protein
LLKPTVPPAETARRRTVFDLQIGEENVTTPLQTTFEVLTSSRNDAAKSVLTSALENSEGANYEAALKALVSRRNRAGHLAVLSRWHLLSEPHREMVREGRGKMSAGLRDAVLSEDDQVFRNACEVVEQFGEFDLVSTLVTLAENKGHQHASQATALVLRMVSLLSEMVHGRSDPNDRRDPNAMRSHLLECLERSVERFRDHHRTELIEAFVVLGGSSSELLRAIIEDPHHACYLTVVHTLSTSESTTVVKLLMGFLKVEHASLASLTLISKRSDDVFITHLLQFVGTQLTEKVKKNLGRIRNFAWLKDPQRDLTNFAEQNQALCVKLLAHSGIDQEHLLELLEKLLKGGEPAGREAACLTLQSLPGDRPNQLVLEAVHDPDPRVQAAAARQLRERRVTGAMGLLIKLIDSPHELVRAAARESLTEYSLETFLQQYDSLNDESRRSTGALVCKVDTQIRLKLAVEMKSTLRKNRLRAIEIAELTGLVTDLADRLIERLEDEDHLVRAAAADALQFCPTAEVQEALQHAAADRSSAVQNAAKSSLSVFAGINLPWGPALTTENPR